MLKKLLKSICNFFRGTDVELTPVEKTICKKRTINEPVVCINPINFDLRLALNNHVKDRFSTTAGQEPRRLLATSLVHYIKFKSGLDIDKLKSSSNKSHTVVSFLYKGIYYKARIKADQSVAIEMSLIDGNGLRSIDNLPLSWNQGALCNIKKHQMVVRKNYVTFDRSLTLSEFSVWLENA